MSANGKILVDSTLGETRAIVVENDKIKFFDYETVNRKQIKGNVYLGKITRVEASLQAAFVDYGGEKHGFLPFSEINPNYYNLPKEQTNDSSDDSSDISNRIHAIKASSGAKLDEKLENIDKNAGEIQEDEQESLNSISNNEDEVETVSDDETFNVMHSTQPATEYQIQEVIRRGQIVLVQVMKEERGNKGAFLTTYLSFAGRYCVLMPNSQKEQVGGISRRIEDLADRRRLRNILEAFDIPENCNVIVRTAGSKKPARDIKRDYQYLVALWNEIREHTLKSKAPAFIHAEGDLLRRTMRDIYDDSVQEVLIQGDEAYNIVSKYTSMIMPDNKYKVKKYNDSIPIFTKFGVEEKLSSLYSPIVHLESGGYIVINPTEALIAIDVNSGKATNERNIEETAYNTNIEAAYEIARQLMLRDLSGLIVIDFIDMLEVQNRIEVERVLKSALAKDKAKIQMARISHFGLLEMSRQRLRPSFYEANTIYCEHCGGKGYIRAYESTALMMLRTIEDELNQEDSLETLTVFASEEFVSYFQNNKRVEIALLESKYKVKIKVKNDNTIKDDGFAIETVARGSDDEHVEEVKSLTTIDPVDIKPMPSREKPSHSKPNWMKKGLESGATAEKVNRKERGGRLGRNNSRTRRRNNSNSDSSSMPNNRKRYSRKSTNTRKLDHSSQKHAKAKGQSSSIFNSLWKRITN